MQKILITGVTGQDGSILTDYILENIPNCIIYGAVRHLSVTNYENIQHLLSNSRFKIVNLDLTDQCSIQNTFTSILPDFVFNFAAQSFVAESWNSPLLTFDVNTLAVIRFLGF